MEFKVLSSELVSLLKIVIKGYDSRDESSFIYFKIKDNKLVAVSDSQSAYFSGAVDITGYQVNDDDESMFYVDGEVLRRLSSIFPDAPVSIKFSINQNSRVFNIKYTGHSFRLPLTSDNTELPTPDGEKIGMIQAQDFFTVLNSLVKIVDTDPSAQEYPSSCLHLRFSGDKMSAMGTDRFAISEITKEFTPENEDTEDETILIRQPQAALLSKTIQPAEVLTLIETQSQFGYIDGQGILSLVSKTQMNPLDYAQMKDIASDECSMIVDYTDFKSTLDTIGKLSFATDTVILKVNEDTQNQIKVMSMTGDVMDLPLEDMVGVTGEHQFMFARSVLTEALIPVDTHKFKLQWKNPGESDEAGLFQIVPIDDDNNAEEHIFIGVIPNA